MAATSWKKGRANSSEPDRNQARPNRRRLSCAQSASWPKRLFNAAAARSFLPIYLMKTKLVLAGKSKADILRATDAAFADKQLPALEAGAMCYMMSKQQYLSDDQPHNWHPHVMMFTSGDAAKSWGANLTGSPVMAADDPEERATVMMIWAGNWSDGTPAPAMQH